MDITTTPLTIEMIVQRFCVMMRIQYQLENVFHQKEGNRKIRVVIQPSKKMIWHLQDYSIVKLRSVMLDFNEDIALINPLEHGKRDTRGRYFYGVTSPKAAVEKRSLLASLGVKAETPCFRFAEWWGSMCEVSPYDSPHCCYVFLGQHNDWMFRDFKGENQLEEISQCKMIDFELAMNTFFS